jgi:2-iminobutanoate/2-iminopropanoate deaminase
VLTRLIALFLLCALGMDAALADTDRQFIVQRNAAPAGPPISDAVLVGNTLYISGMLGLDPKSNRAPEDPQIEAKLVMERVKKTVESAGLAMDDIVSIQVFCTDLALYDTFNNVYRAYFPQGFPARAFLGAAALVRGAHFEVLGIAVRRSTR